VVSDRTPSDADHLEILRRNRLGSVLRLRRAHARWLNRLIVAIVASAPSLAQEAWWRMESLELIERLSDAEYREDQEAIVALATLLHKRRRSRRAA